jgi:hypothetical protein
LKNGEQIAGTLWNLGEDYLTVKVKKGPLYSKEEKFGYSEIDYLEDLNGQRIEVEQLRSKKSSTSVRKSSNKTKKNTIPIYIKTEKKGDTETKPLQEKTASDTGVKSKDNRVTKTTKTFKNEKFRSEWPAVSKTPRKESGRSANSSRSSVALNKIDSKNESQTTAKEASSEVVPPSRAEFKKLKILKLQIIALFSATILALALMVVLKIKGLAGYSYGKHSLFPARLVKVNGKYGVIDQGSEDGVEVDDIIRLHRKVGRSIKYVSKGKIIKVVKNYAAIQLVKKSRHGPASVGDVGFRDRSLILSSIKMVRIYLGGILKGLAKGLDLAAKTLTVKPQYPEKEITIIATELRQKQSKKSAKKSKRQNGKTLETATQSKDETELVGFGAEER